MTEEGVCLVVGIVFAVVVGSPAGLAVGAALWVVAQVFL